MESLKLKRKPLRAALTTTTKAVDDELSVEVPDLERLGTLNSQLADKFQRLSEVQDMISTLLLEPDVPEEEYITDFEAAEAYRDKFLSYRNRIESHLSRPRMPTENNSIRGEPSGTRKFKLPKLELRKFSGELTDWLSFWSQFSKIHDDEEIVPEDKFQYLIQAMVPGSRAASLIESFPATAENYPKAIEQLKERFGRDDLLVQIYVRELLSMVMKNAATGRMKTDLATLYDRIESRLRTLETLGRTKEKFADFLAPLVESCLPEDVLRAWERSRNAEEHAAGDSRRTLENLMTFLRQEVNSEEMISLARSGFSSGSESNRRPTQKRIQSEPTEVATASSLMSTGSTSENSKPSVVCIFCDKMHPSSVCFSAQQTSLDERKKILQRKGACFVCLKPGHISRRCKLNPKCMICGRKHYTLMCPEREVTEPKAVVNKSEISHSSALSNHVNTGTVLLQTLSVKISVDGKDRLIRAILDTGSQKSFVSEKIARLMRLKTIRREDIVHGLFGGKETKPLTHTVHIIHLSDVKDTFRCHFEVLSQRKICGAVPRVENEVIIELKKKSIEIADLPDERPEVELLIGADVAGKLLTGNIVELDSGLVAVETKLGWTVLGKQKNNVTPVNNVSVNSVMTIHSLYVNSASISELWNLDVLGIRDPAEHAAAKKLNSEIFVEFQNKLVILPSGRYQVELPWKADHTELPSNKALALKRHETVCRRENARGNLESYQAVFHEWENMGIIERVPAEEIEAHAHYLPHRPVIKETSETTKIRPVFDASAHEKGKPSLNGCLEKGPNLIELIPDIFDRFRIHPIGLSADIEKAFLQLEVAPHHRDFLRFFYPSEVAHDVFRHCRVVFGVSSSPFLLAAAINHHLTNVPTEFRDTSQKLLRSFYVDNCVTSVPDVPEMERFISEAKEIMSKACFNLRGWLSNKTCCHISESCGDVPVLGMVWNLEKDTLRCNISVADMDEGLLTKRSILSAAQRLFDPLGILTPCTLLPKQLLQETWVLKLGWDVPLPDKLKRAFCKWVEEIPQLEQVEILRCTLVNSSSQLHVFVDACKGAYAACVFLRSNTPCGVVIRLLRAKARVAPLKTLTIPRLELMACCIGARLAHAIRIALGSPDLPTVYWSDSMVALWWIQERGSWSVFVANRVKEIHSLTSPESWRHVPGVMNPADLLSRGCTPNKMIETQWWNGPSWLLQPPEEWPPDELTPQMADVEMEERKSLCVISLIQEEPHWYATKFSNFHSIIRMVAWMLRFLNNVRKTEHPKKSGELSLQEIVEAEKRLIKFVQAQHFGNKNDLPSINTFEDAEGILRVKTRITEREDVAAFIAPILLPERCPFTDRLVECKHRENCHAGVQILLSILREKFWIVKARKTVRSILNGCMKCRRYKAKGIVTDSAPLPKDRVKDANVFEVVGIDLAGPLYLKTGDKVWIVLFTCAIYRAVHLELVSSLSTDSFLLSLRRFMARRGRPRVIYSDNGTNFRGAQRELWNVDWQSVVREAQTHRIMWKFNPPTAAWWGGWWERLVRLIKELLRRTLGKASLTYEELLTVLCGCEAVINSRPLTYVSEDPRDLVPLTPAMY